MKYKINPNSSIFYDPATGIMITKGEEVEITPAQASSFRTKDAIRGKHIIPVLEEKVEEKEEKEVEETETSYDEERFEELSIMTVSQILEEFDFMNDEDLKKAKSKNKAEMIKFLLETEKLYE